MRVATGISAEFTSGLCLLLTGGALLPGEQQLFARLRAIDLSRPDIGSFEPMSERDKSMGIPDVLGFWAGVGVVAAEDE